MKIKKLEPFALSPSIGTIKAAQIVGREKEIVSLLRLLKGQSVSVEEIRRMGKTLLVQKLAYWCNNENLLPKEFKNENFKAKYFTFQGKKNLGELIDFLIREFEKLKSWHQIDLSKTYNTIAEILKIPTFKVFGVDVSLNLPSYEKKWKDIFTNILDDIADSLDENTKLILIFDELPIMLWDWYKQGNHKEAIELLDVLRERRQLLENKGLRFVFCGSVGMNVILDRFKSEFGYTGEATNEMEEFNLGAFNLEEVSFLCHCYMLSGFNIEGEAKELWNQIYKLSNGIPFYISKMFNILQTEFDKNISSENIDEAYKTILHKSKNHKVFNQLIDRINTYYNEPKEQAKTMIVILSFLAKHPDFISEREIINGLSLEEEVIKSKLYILFSDHYLIREINEEQRLYKFKYEIFRKWWKLNIA